MTDMVDHLARTRAQMEACAKRGQWDHVMAIGGFKSRDAAKAAMGYSIIAVDPVIKEEPKPKPFRTYSDPDSIYCPRKQCRITPAPRDWASDVRQRISALKMDLYEFSELLGKSRTYMSACLGARNHCPPGARILIEAQITRLEKIERAA